MITPKTKQALDAALDELKRDGYRVLVIMLGQQADEDGAEVLCSETNDLQASLGMLRTTFERFILPAMQETKATEDSSRGNCVPVKVRKPVEPWEASSRMKPDGTWEKFPLGQKPTLLTALSPECSSGGCEKCAGFFSRDDFHKEFIFCVHECHLASHHDSYVPRP